MAFISYTERPILALGSAWEAGAGLIWVDFNFVVSLQAPYNGHWIPGLPKQIIATLLTI